MWGPRYKYIIIIVCGGPTYWIQHKFIYIGIFRYEMFLKTSCFNFILMKYFWKNMYGNSISKSLECPKSKNFRALVGGAYSAPQNSPADSERASLIRPATSDGASLDWLGGKPSEARTSDKVASYSSWGVWGRCKPPTPNGVRGGAPEMFAILELWKCWRWHFLSIFALPLKDEYN